MKHDDITRALSTLRPGAEWNLSGDALSGIIWLDTVQTRPTDDDILKAITVYVPPLSLRDQVAILQAQVASLLAARK